MINIKYLKVLVKIENLDPKPVTIYPFLLELYVDYTVRYITGDASIDAEFNRNGYYYLKYFLNILFKHNLNFISTNFYNYRSHK
jgi:hypothetical protein